MRRLFLFAHPDDEIAVAAWMRREGAFAWWAHHTPVRRDESLRVAERLGIEAVGFGDLPDGGMQEAILDLAAQVEAVLKATAPDEVVVPSFEHGHPDHDALHYTARLCWPGPLWEFPMYRPLAPGQAIQRYVRGEDKRIPLTLDEVRLKFDLTFAYPSQRIGRILRAHARFVPGAGTIRWERYRVQESLDYRQPNASPRVARWLMRTGRWERWLRALERAQAAVSP
jgi:LmbE family N-acetylglucosaminyl deacetylase